MKKLPTARELIGDGKVSHILIDKQVHFSVEDLKEKYPDYTVNEANVVEIDGKEYCLLSDMECSPKKKSKKK